MTHNYRQLSAPELLTWFVKITDGYIMKGRDTRALAYCMDNRNLSPTQMLAGMIEFSQMPDTKDIPTFLRVYDSWLEENVITAEATVVKYLTGQDLPPCYWRYMDLLDWDVGDALVESEFHVAKLEVERYLSDALDAPATIGSRGRAAQRSQQPRTPYANPGQRAKPE